MAMLWRSVACQGVPGKGQVAIGLAQCGQACTENAAETERASRLWIAY